MKTQSEAKKTITRFGEFGLIKALAILGLPAVHLMEEAIEGGYASPELMRFGALIIGLCAFGPSVFMMCMGFGIGGGKTSAEGIRKNGIQFLLIGAILNIFRWFIPGVVQSLTVHTHLIDDIQFCLQSDIYYFVGIFFIFYSFLKKFKITPTRMIFISVILLTVNMILTPIMGQYITNPILSSLVGNIGYVDNTSCFPLLSWAIFPSVGILLGDILKKSDETKREIIMRRMLDFSFVLFFSFTTFLIMYGIDFMQVLVSPSNEYITDLPNVILLISLALFLVSLTYYLCKKIGASSFMKFMLTISACIVPFYFVQWISIAWIFYALRIFNMPAECFGIGWYVLSVIAITALCIFVSKRYGMRLMKFLLKITTIKKKKKKM